MSLHSIHNFPALETAKVNDRVQIWQDAKSCWCQHYEGIVVRITPRQIVVRRFASTSETKFWKETKRQVGYSDNACQLVGVAPETWDRVVVNVANLDAGKKVQASTRAIAQPTTATQTAQNATIPASEGKDTAPEASDLVAIIENLANCVGIVVEFAPSHGLPSVAVGELAKVPPMLREVGEQVATLERANAELVATLQMAETVFNVRQIDSLAAFVAIEKIRNTLAKLNK